MLAGIFVLTASNGLFERWKAYDEPIEARFMKAVNIFLTDATPPARDSLNQPAQDTSQNRGKGSRDAVSTAGRPRVDLKNLIRGASATQSRTGPPVNSPTFTGDESKFPRLYDCAYTSGSSLPARDLWHFPPLPPRLT
jgi:hypothetical protein